MVAADAVWWVVAMRLVKGRVWRLLVSAFMAGQIGLLILSHCELDWHLYTPSFVPVAFVVWHRMAAPLGVAGLVLLGMVRAWPWIIRRLTPSSQPSVSGGGRRESSERSSRLAPLNRLVANRSPSALQSPSPQPSPPRRGRSCRTLLKQCIAEVSTAGSWARRGTPTRREFIGACAAAAPSLFTVGLTPPGVAQLNRFRVRRLTVSMPALPRALDGSTIAHVSDMHVGVWTQGRVLREIVNTTNALRPDMVLLTGDLINYELTDLSEAIATVKGMEGRYGLWMVEGNHDLFDDGTEFERRVKAAGIPLLQDDSAVAEVRGYPVQFFGLRWMGRTRGGERERDRLIGAQIRLLMKRREPEAFPILLAHHPHAFDAAVKADLPLTVAGHTHGGQWMLDSQRGVGPAIFRYWSGLYARGGSRLIVSNGVGNVFPIRINAPAEIVHITLRCA